ncbi:flavin reductase family protein [Pseudoprimorskyibacter insulae]|uniref:FMN reductase (NADH) NtaB n=1 Tax=Pseudoprimorskyibacter insulae TaxID=1695997 RepID=A0A2R8AV54_9RHOB|nr:flavin reductase family protein [Pseudoprimorskyibacter insulae]SPF79911.1 FMN reductase (NADH) NtaB [Pseudoprimorskyibacter insulae]
MSEQAQIFDPAEADPRSFRDALGKFATGVTVITCMTPTGPIGITANSFASLSLTPPLVLWSPAKRSSRYPFYVAADYFAIHVLGAGQAALSSGFARSGDAFGAIDWRESAHRTPLIEGCLSRFECRNIAQHDGGDHTVVIGQVIEVETRDGAPLIFSAGQFGTFDG